MQKKYIEKANTRFNEQATDVKCIYHDVEKMEGSLGMSGSK